MRRASPRRLLKRPGIDRLDGISVDDPNTNSARCQLIGRGDCLMNGNSGRDDCDPILGRVSDCSASTD